MDDGRKGIFMSVKKNAHSGEHAHAGYMMKGWKLRLLRLLALLIIVCVGAAACSKKDNDTAQEPFTVKLGVLLDFSGDKKEESEEMYRAVSLAVDEINASGGVLTEGYSIELIKKDDAGDYMNSVAGYYQLAQEGACAVIGTNNSKGMEELVKASASANVPVITPSVTDDSIVAAADFIYQSCFSDKYMTEAMASFLESGLAASNDNLSVALVCPAENERCTALYEDMAAAISSRNISTVYAHELSDYTDEKLIELFDGIVSSQAGYVFIPAGVDDIEKILSAAKQCGYSGSFLGLPEWYGYDSDTHGYDVYIAMNMAADRDTDMVGAFIKKFGTVVSDGVRPAYDSVYFIRDAIEKGYLATAASIALKLPFLEGSTPLGDYVIGAYGNIEKTVDIIRMTGGQKKYVTTLFE